MNTMTPRGPKAVGRFVRRSIRLAAAFAILGLISLATPGWAIEWESLDFTPISTMQGVNAAGGTTWAVPRTPAPENAQAYRLRGVVLNSPEDMLDTTPQSQDGPAWFMGGQWQIFIQATAMPDDATEYPELVGDLSGTTLWMGQNYGNHGWHFSDPLRTDYSYSDEAWIAELQRLNYPIDAATGLPVTEPLRPGDLIEVRARGGLHYRGKFNCNEQHDNDPIFDFDIILLQRGVEIATAEISLADVIDGNNVPLFDPTRTTGAELYQGRSVALQNVTISDASNWESDGEITVTDGTRTIDVWLGCNAAFADAALPSGTFDLTGIFDQEAPWDANLNGYDLTKGYFLWATSPTNFAPSTNALPGDANQDGTVNDADAAVLAQRWLASEASWFDGDFNGDHRIDDRDAAILAAHWVRGASEEAVPEPSAVVLLAGLALAAVGMKRRKGD